MVQHLLAACVTGNSASFRRGFHQRVRELTWWNFAVHSSCFDPKATDLGPFYSLHYFLTSWQKQHKASEPISSTGASTHADLILCSNGGVSCAYPNTNHEIFPIVYRQVALADVIISDCKPFLWMSGVGLRTLANVNAASCIKLEAPKCRLEAVWWVTFILRPRKTFFLNITTQNQSNGYWCFKTHQ